MRGTFGLAVLIAALAATPALALDGLSLTIGDKVDSVDIAHFFQGAPVKALDKEKIYVLEFWATW